MARFKNSLVVVFALTTPLWIFGSCSNKDDSIAPDTSAKVDAGVEPDSPVDCSSSKFEASSNKMVEVATPSGKKYCIDQYKVTRAQYKLFVEKAGKDKSLQAPYCQQLDVDNLPKWPMSGDNGVDEKGSWEPADAPMYYVHYCGATAYCTWAGKKLCGAVGKGQLTYELVSDGKNTVIKDADVVLANVEGDQWYNACTQGGKTTQATSHPEKCATSVDTPVTESCPGDIEPFTQVYGLFDVVGEITDLCGRSGCVHRGALSNDCVDFGLLGQDFGFRNVGFRCCAD